MSATGSTPLDLAPWARTATAGENRVSKMAAGLIGSEILKIAAEIRKLAQAGAEICNLTVGDFDPKQFPIPDPLRRAIQEALDQGETNYPPSDGVLALRQAVQRFYARELGLNYPIESILIAGGARPVIYGIYRALIDPGDPVLFPLPSWNNNHYIHMTGAHPVPLACRADERFLPTRDELLHHLPTARLVCLNTPLNPTGTAIDPGVLRGICEAILEENHRREQRGLKPCFLMYDHIYWMLTVGDVGHVTPPGLIPEMARYTIFVDGISKAFAATGVRVGWALGPADVVERMSAILGHVGAWAPRAEQLATAQWLDQPEAMRGYLAQFLRGIGERLHALHAGFAAMKAKGLPVDAIPPMGAIYLTARVHPFGKRTPQGEVLNTNNQVRRYLLDAAAVGVVPFQAFGVPDDGGWFRLSVGAASVAAIQSAIPRIEAALLRLS
jgi:aspartate aminotransferase